MENKISSSWIKKDIEPRTTNKYGTGLFTNKNIKKETLIAVFGGHIYTDNYENNLPSEISDNGIQISDKLIIGIVNKSEIEDAIYFNHSCDPNCGIKGQIFLIAKRDIKKNEELTFDYAMTLGGNKKYEMTCLCQTKRCRKKITNLDWKLPELQKRYKGYFQWYLEEKIKKLNKK